MKKYFLVILFIIGAISIVVGYIVTSSNKRTNLLCNCQNKCVESCPLNNTKVGCDCEFPSNSDGETCTNVEPAC